MTYTVKTKACGMSTRCSDCNNMNTLAPSRGVVNYLQQSPQGLVWLRQITDNTWTLNDADKSTHTFHLIPLI